MDVNEDTTVSMSVWDIGGQSLGGKMIGNYIYGAAAVLLCYDITNAQSFADLDDWLRVVKSTFEGGKMPLLMLVGNKIDLNHLRAVRLERHTQWAKENGCRASFFVSAKSGDQVGLMTLQVAADLAGITLKKAELDGAARVVKAEVVNHPNELPDDGKKKRKKEGEGAKKSGACVVA